MFHYQREPLNAFELHDLHDGPDDHDDSHERDLIDETDGLPPGARIQYEFYRNRGRLLDSLLAEQDQPMEEVLHFVLESRVENKEKKRDHFAA